MNFFRLPPRCCPIYYFRFELNNTHTNWLTEFIEWHNYHSIGEWIFCCCCPFSSLIVWLNEFVSFPFFSIASTAVVKHIVFESMWPQDYYGIIMIGKRISLFWFSNSVRTLEHLLMMMRMKMTMNKTKMCKQSILDQFVFYSDFRKL